MTAVATSYRAPAPAEHTGGTGRVAVELAARNLVRIRRIPATFVPALVMPVFFVVTFSGQYSGITALPGFVTDNILSWFVPMAVLQGAMFAGQGVALSTAQDLEGGFMDRLLLAPTPRVALALGSVLAGTARAAVSYVLVVTVGLLAGAAVPGGPLGHLTLLAAALGIAIAAALWGLGVMYRVQNQNAGPLVQVALFMAIFLSTAQVPLAVMQGWLHSVARVNPMTNVLRLARAGYLDGVAWAEVWGGLVAIAGLWVLLGAFAARGMRRLVP